MKFWFPTLGLVASISLPVLAQEMPPQGSLPPDAPPSDGRFATMRAMHDQFVHIAMEQRTKMLGALSPAHRSALANILGQFAVADSPDAVATVAKIDALLTASEKSAVLAAQADGRTRMHALMGANGPGPQMRRPDGGTPPAEHTPDAGEALLHVVAIGERGGGMGPGMMGPPRR